MTKKQAKRRSMPKSTKTRKKSSPTSTKHSIKSRFYFYGVALFWRVTILAAFLSFFWLVYLNALVLDGFEGRRFDIPARVYSESQDLYPGLGMEANELVRLLNVLGYQKSNQTPVQGRYRNSHDAVLLHTRPFTFWDGAAPEKQLIIRFQNQSIVSMSDFSGRSVPYARLDPMYMGHVLPGEADDRVLVALKDVPPSFILGLLLIEDSQFFSHRGVSVAGIARAVLTNIQSGRAVQGGSTVTNQLVKNLYLSSEKTWGRKVNEALMSLLLEAHFSKNEILETYLNEVYVGQDGQRSINGFGLGAHYYFGASLSGLALHQQALLVGLIKGPSFYNPRRRPERAKTRRNLVLDVWLSKDLINQKQYLNAINAPLGIKENTAHDTYPAFMDMVRRQLSQSYRQADLKNQGLSVFTTFDPLAQQALEQSLSAGLVRLESQHNQADQLQGAAVLTRPSTGDILAMVGDRHPRRNGFNRALDAQRPVGSLIKPAVYLAALEQGYTLASPISDEPVAIRSGDGEIWSPKNYNLQSNGEPLLVDALAKSYNQATARLGMSLGLGRVFEVMQRLGVGDSVSPVPSMMLGTFDLSPLGVAQFYQTISGNGFYSPLNAIRAVSDAQNKTIERYALSAEQRFLPEPIFLLQEALHASTVSGTATKISTEMPNNRWSAGKTGTTDDNRDAWFAGFTGDRQLVVWVGRDDNASTHFTGSSGALPIWIDVMKSLKPQTERHSLPRNMAFVRVNEAGAQVPLRCKAARDLPFVLGTEPALVQRCAAQGNDRVESESIESWWQRWFGD